MFVWLTLLTVYVAGVYRHMYVTSRSTGRGRILRYTMDGKNETLLIGRSASYPNGLDIDFKSECYNSSLSGITQCQVFLLFYHML